MQNSSLHTKELVVDYRVYNSFIEIYYPYSDSDEWIEINSGGIWVHTIYKETLITDLRFMNQEELFQYSLVQEHPIDVYELQQVLRYFYVIYDNRKHVEHESLLTAHIEYRE